MRGSVTEVWIEFREPSRDDGGRKLLLPLGGSSRARGEEQFCRTQ